VLCIAHRYQALAEGRDFHRASHPRELDRINQEELEAVMAPIPELVDQIEAIASVMDAYFDDLSNDDSSIEFHCGIMISRIVMQINWLFELVLHALMGAAYGAKNVYGLKAYAGMKGGQFHTLLYSSTDGQLKAMIEADHFGRMRTGAASGIATRLLAIQGEVLLKTPRSKDVGYWDHVAINDMIGPTYHMGTVPQGLNR